MLGVGWGGWGPKPRVCLVLALKWVLLMLTISGAIIVQLIPNQSKDYLPIVRELVWNINIRIRNGIKTKWLGRVWIALIVEKRRLNADGFNVKGKDLQKQCKKSWPNKE